jgi:hypothetical protein
MKSCMISGFHCNANELCTLLRFYVVQSDNSTPMFRTIHQSHLQGSSSQARLLECLNPEDKTNRLSWKSVRNYHSVLHKIPEHRSNEKLTRHVSLNDTFKLLRLCVSEILEWNKSMKHWWNDWQQQTKHSQEKLVSVPFCAPQIPNYCTFLPVMRQLNMLTSISQFSTKCKVDAAFLPSFLINIWIKTTNT